MAECSSAMRFCSGISLVNTSPKLSILIATYNAGKTLEACLTSVAAQSFKDYEILIADGLSNDDTVSIIEKHRNLIKYWHSKRDDGIYDAWNSLINKSTAEYICFIGADDIFANSEALQSIFQQASDADFDLITSKGLLLGATREHVFGASWDYRKLARRITVCHPGLMHNRKLFEKFGNFDTSYRIVGDYEFLLRLSSDTRVLHVDAITVKVADGGVSRSRYMEMLKEKRRAQSECKRIGPLIAWLNFFDKLWRIPIAKALKIPF